LRVLFLRFRALPANPGRALGSRRGPLLGGTTDVSGEAVAIARDWLRRPRTSLVATFAGIALNHVPGFVAAQLVGAARAALVGAALFPGPKRC
jgi:hypothetical protein